MHLLHGRRHRWLHLHPLCKATLGYKAWKGVPYMVWALWSHLRFVYCGHNKDLSRVRGVFATLKICIKCTYMQDWQTLPLLHVIHQLTGFVPLPVQQTKVETVSAQISISRGTMLGKRSEKLSNPSSPKKTWNMNRLFICRLYRFA